MYVFKQKSLHRYKIDYKFSFFYFIIAVFIVIYLIPLIFYVKILGSLFPYYFYYKNFINKNTFYMHAVIWSHCDFLLYLFSFPILLIVNVNFLQLIIYIYLNYLLYYNNLKIEYYYQILFNFYKKYIVL